MATVKNYGLAGVGSDLQFGKGGVHFVNESNEFKAYANDAATGNADTTTLVNVHGAEPTALTHLTTKNYVDNVAAGLDPKESVRVATAANIDLATGGLLTIDGVTLNEGDRVLVRVQGTTTENGIYVADSGTWVRAEDMDGSPSNEVASGQFTFVEEGDTYGNTGWVTTGLGILSLGVDPINFVQFSGAGETDVIGGAGITVVESGTDFTVSANTSGSSTGISGGDNIIVRSTGTQGQVLRSTGVDGAEATWGALELNLDGDVVSGQLAMEFGGTHTDTSAYATDSLMLTLGAGAGVAELAKGANNTVLRVDGSGVLGYGKVDLNADTSGTLDVDQGGTGNSTLTDGAILIGAGTSPVEFVGPDADATKYLRSNGAATNPVFDWISQLHDGTDGSLVVDTSGAGADSNLLIDVTASGVVTLEGVGTGSDVDMVVTPKGAGQVTLDGLTYPKAADVTDDAEGAFLNLIDAGGTELQLSFPTWVTEDINTGFAAWTGEGTEFWAVSGSGGTFTLNEPGYGYIRSRKVYWTQPQSTSLTQNATNFIYIDSDGNIGVTTAGSQSLYEDNIVLFEALDDGTNVTVVRENHPYNFDTQVSAYNHRVIGTIISGTDEQVGADISIGDNTAGATELDVSGGAFVEDHGLRDTITAVDGIDWNVYYLKGSSQWVRQAVTKHLGAYWNNAGTPELTADFAVFGLYVSKSDLETGVKYFAVMDDGDYANVGAAQTAINDGTIQTPTAELYDLELTRLAYVIMNGNADTLVGNDTIESVTISKEVLGSQVISGGGGGTASGVSTNTGAFDNILDSGDSTVQIALETLDDHLLDDHKGVNTTGKNNDDILQWNSSATEWQTVAPVDLGIGSYNTITADSGSASTTVGNATLEFVGGEGIVTSASNGSTDAVTIELNFPELTTATPELTDTVAFYDSTATGHRKMTFTEMFQNLDVVTATFGSGMIAKTADDTYAGRTISVEGAGGEAGLTIDNGDGVAGNPTLGLSITGIAATATTFEDADEFVMFDSSASANVKVTVGDLFDPANNPALATNNEFISADATPTTTYVHTNLTTGSVIVAAEGDQVAEFASTGGAGDSSFIFETGTAGEVIIEATGTPSDVDIRLVPQGNGQVFIGDAGDGVIQADDDANLTVKGGDENATGGGDLILEGGDGATTNGDVFLQPGGGAGTAGQVCVRDGAEALITCFVGGAGTPDSSLVITSGTGEVVIGSTGAANADIVLDPNGTGFVVAPSGYDMSTGPDEAFATKEYVDSQISTTTDELVLRATLTETGGTIGTMPNVATKGYFVDRIVVTVLSSTGTWSAGGDITGTGTYATGASDIDYNVPGTYIIDADLNGTDEGGVAFNMGGLTGITAASVKVAVHYKATSAAL